MKKYKNIMIFSMMLLLLLLLPMICKVKAADDFKVIPTKQSIEQNKRWIIKFNDILNISTVNNNTIYVTDESGKKVLTNLEVGLDKKSVYISPKVSYEYGKTYFLIANKGIEKISGKSMATNVKMKFIIKNNTVVPPTSGDNNITIASVEDIIKSVVEGDKYNLPSKVKVKTIQGESKEENIVWNSTVVDTSKAGTYAYKGKVQGYPKEVILTLLVTSKGNGKHIVCIDPGHGGYDSGAVGSTGIKEKDITLKVAQKTGSILESKGIKVVYTRTSDKVSWPSSEGLDLKKRTEIANSMNPNYFVSIHCNSVDNAPYAKGTETYYSSGSVLGEKLATNIQNELIKKLSTTNRGTKTANFYVLRNSNSPAILTELEFISNPETEKDLNSEEFQNKCAQAIANGVLISLGLN